MIDHPLIQFLFAIAFIAAACVICYKLSCKLLDVIFQSNRSYKNTCFLIALLFITSSVFAYNDFTNSAGSIWFFFLMVFCAAIFVYLGVSNIDISGSQTVITVDFNQEAMNCLLKVLKNEQERLETYRNQDSECDLDIVNNLIIKLKNLKTKETTFEFLEAVVILTALDYEMNQQDKSTLTQEELTIGRVFYNKLKEIVIKEFADEAL
jgi:hypothetical protein